MNKKTNDVVIFLYGYQLKTSEKRPFLPPPRSHSLQINHASNIRYTHMVCLKKVSITPLRQPLGSHKDRPPIAGLFNTTVRKQ